MWKGGDDPTRWECGEFKQLLRVILSIGETQPERQGGEFCLFIILAQTKRLS